MPLWTLGDDLALAQQHEAVQRVDFFFGRFDEVEDGGGGKALLVGRAAREFLRRSVGGAHCDQGDHSEKLPCICNTRIG